MFNDLFLLDRTVYEKMWKNVVELGRPLTIWHLRFSCWIPKDTDIHSEYVILIAFPLQQLSYKHILLLFHMYIACLGKKLFPIFEAFHKNQMCGQKPLTYSNIHCVCGDTSGSWHLPERQTFHPTEQIVCHWSKGQKHKSNFVAC